MKSKRFTLNFSFTVGKGVLHQFHKNQNIPFTIHGKKIGINPFTKHRILFNLNLHILVDFGVCMMGVKNNRTKYIKIKVHGGLRESHLTYRLFWKIIVLCPFFDGFCCLL